MLIVHSPHDRTNRYARYLEELLTIEGFRGLESIASDELGEWLRRRPDLVVLPRIHLSEANNQALATYVTEGGRLLTFMPEPSLAAMLGLRPSFSVLRDGLLTCASGSPLDGLPLDPIQVIVPTATYDHPSSGPIATVAGRDDAMTTTGAIWSFPLDGGEVSAVGFDLPHAVARLRQGDPEMADLPSHRWDHIHRPSDLFVGQLDPRQAVIPQADILTAILGRLVESLAPQPRLWYYPAASQRGVMVMTSDDDWSTREQFTVMTDVLRQYEAACTFYVVHSTVLDDDLMARYEADGHVFSVHPSMPADRRTASPVNEAQMRWVPEMVRSEVERHRREHGRPVNTIRNHAIRWTGYTDLPKVHAELGIRGESNFVAVGLINAGFMSGSGRVAPFVDLDGTVIDHLQIPALWTEEALVSGGHSSSERWQYSRAQDATNGIIERAINRYHTPVTFNSHPVSFATYSRPLIESNWATARELGAPIVSADAWLAWNDALRGVEVIRGEGHIEIASAVSIDRLTLLFPAEEPTVAPATTSSRQTIWDRDYDVVEVTGLVAGEHRVIGAKTPSPTVA